ncbi:MAG: class I SAM-dependent methyltransferase, partial [Bdellovibrionales bacterium]|nr:class I SAM-dependent methyltransferase [Bdellovibrionales bacterium]
KRVPSRLWRSVHRRYWSRVWAYEQEEEAKALGFRASEPIQGSERAHLIEHISDAYPFKRVLEVGCSFGQNFVSLAPHYPSVAFVGIDADAHRIEEGRRMLAARGIRNVELFQANAEALDEFEAQSFDVVYCCALLLYADPPSAERIVREMIRVAKRTVLLMEQHREREEAEFVRRPGREDGYWIRDYFRLASRCAPASRILLEPVPAPRWPAEQWKRFAHVIRIELPALEE